MRWTTAGLGVLLSGLLATGTGCKTCCPAEERGCADAVAAYRARAAGDVEERPAAHVSGRDRLQAVAARPATPPSSAATHLADLRFETPYLTLSAADDAPATQPQPRAESAADDAWAVKEGYWRSDLWHQAGYEAREFITHDVWRGFKTSFWDLENALVLTATMGASIAIRETGVDGTVRGRVDGHRQLGDADEPIQILGHPGTHFAGAGVLWLASAAMQDVREHEVARSLVQALAVNGASTLLLKAATNTRGPDGESHAWPSGHTSSSFTAAAVLNEYYGPWVGIPSLALAGLVGYQRIDSRTHDFSDVVFGGMLGYVIGTSIARDQQAQFPEVWGMKVLPFSDPATNSSGLALYKQWR